MSLVVMMEVVTIYIIFIYLSEMDRYSVIVMIGVGICIIIGSGNRWVSLLILVILWPMFYGYIEWVAIWISGVKLRETYKKLLTLMMVMRLIFISVRVRYVVVLSLGVYRVSSAIALRVYSWIMIRGGITMLILSYVVGNSMIELNWKMLVVRVLPLPAFFMKVMRSWLILYVVIYFGMCVIVNSNGN